MNTIIIYILVIFMILGGLDKIFNNRFGLGKKFDEGFMALGPLAIAMVGIISLAPVLAKVLKPIIVPIYSFLGADPSMFATTFLAIDMGGYPLAMELAQTEQAGLFAGIILGSMLGATIVFSIPVALGIIKKEDHQFLAVGILAGIITIPIGCLAGGLTAGFSLAMIIKNLTPIIIVSLLIVLGLWKIPKKMIRGFHLFSRTVVALITLAVIAIVFETLTGIVVIPGMAPIWGGFKAIGSIAIILLGAFPMIYFITKYFKKPLMKIGQILGIGETSTAGMIATLANNIPMFSLMKDMDDKGKILNCAFAVSAAFVFGDHLGFAAGVNQQMIFPMVVGKLIGGVSAVAVANFIFLRSRRG